MRIMISKFCGLLLRKSIVVFFFFQRQSAPFWPGSSSNHDDDGNKNVTNLHIWQWKTIVVHALHVQFSFLYILQTFSLFPQREMTCFAVVHVDDMSIRWQMLNFVLLSMKRSFQVNVGVGSLNENTKDSGTFSMYLCGYLACSARAPAQHCWMCCANERNIVGPRFDDRETIEMLALVGSEVWPVSNFIQQLPTSRNNTQQHTTWCANARNKLGPTMLRLVGQQCCEPLHGSLEHILQA